MIIFDHSKISQTKRNSNNSLKRIKKLYLKISQLKRGEINIILYKENSRKYSENSTSRKKGEEVGASTIRKTQSYESEEGKTNKMFLVYFVRKQVTSLYNKVRWLIFLT